MQAWAADGFAVIQPTHLDSWTLALASDDPRTPHIWRSRIEDRVRVLDALDLIEGSVASLHGRLDRTRLALAGHSWGATTASALIGARIVDPAGRVGPSMTDPRITSAVLIAVTGTGGDDLTPFAAGNLAFMNPEFTQMTAPTLILAGDQDHSPLSVRGPGWWTDAYHLSAAPKALLTLFGAEHSMGGITGYHDPETTDESPERVALLQHASTAYLHHTLELNREPWTRLQNELAADSGALGRIDSK